MWYVKVLVAKTVFTANLLLLSDVFWFNVCWKPLSARNQMVKKEKNKNKTKTNKKNERTEKPIT